MVSGRKVPPVGVSVPTVVFFHEDDTLDTENIARHALRMAQGGMTSIVVQGTNGEAVHLDANERSLAIQTTRRALDEHGYQHVPIIAGTGMMSLKATLEMTRLAKTAGAEFSLVISPHYWVSSMTKPILIEYYTKLADASELPIIIYNFPGVTAGIDLDSDTILLLAKHPNIVGAKFTCGNVGKIHRIAAHTSADEFAALGGKSDFLIHGLLAGATGSICGLCNLFPKVHTECFRRYKAGDIAGAVDLQNLLADADSVTAPTGGISGHKAAIQKYFGYGTGIARSPLPNADMSKLAVSDGVYGQLMDIEARL